jgi:adenine phosphoribosyltransferase
MRDRLSLLTHLPSVVAAVGNAETPRLEPSPASSKEEVFQIAPRRPLRVTSHPVMEVAELRAKIRDIKDFPTEGILFRDITTLLKDAAAWESVIDHLASLYRSIQLDVVVGVESRGFIFGGALAHQLRAGFVPVRKRGKLPARTIEEEYALEYGRDVLAIHEDAIHRGERVLAVDDLLATGGTMSATLRLIERLGGVIVGAAFLIELGFLGGRSRLKGYPLESLIIYD